MKSPFIQQEWTVTGFARIDPLPVRRFGEPPPFRRMAGKNSPPSCWIVVAALVLGPWGLISLAVAFSSSMQDAGAGASAFSVLWGLICLAIPLGMIFGPGIVQRRRQSQWDRTYQQHYESWDGYRVTWERMEAERFRCTRRLYEVPVKANGLITSHGGRADSDRSLVATQMAQWIMKGEEAIIIDANGGLTPSLLEFASMFAGDQGGTSEGGSLDDLVASTMASSFFQASTAEGRENIYRVLFGYGEGAGINRRDEDFGEVDSLLRVTTAALDQGDGTDTSLRDLCQALHFLIDRTNRSLELTQAQQRALEGVSRRIENADVRRLLNRLEPLSDMVDSVSPQPSLVRMAGRGSTLIRLYSKEAAGQAHARGLEQRLLAEAVLHLMDTLPSHIHIALVFRDFEDAAAPYLARLAKRAGHRQATTLVCLPNLTGAVGEWATRTDQNGPIIFRLPDPDDAQRAARFYGQGHRMVFSQISHERGTSNSENWSQNESKTWGQSVSGGASGFSFGGGTTSHESSSETYSRSLEFDIEPREIQRLGDTLGIVKTSDNVPWAMDAYPPLWGEAHRQLAIEREFSERYQLTPEQLSDLHPTYASVDVLLNRQQRLLSQA